MEGQCSVSILGDTGSLILLAPPQLHAFFPPHLQQAKPLAHQGPWIMEPCVASEAQSFELTLYSSNFRKHFICIKICRSNNRP